MARISPLAVIPPILFVALTGAFLWGMNRDDPNELPSTLAGRQAPIVALDAFDGRPVIDQAILQDGTPKLVNFWASWCAPCRVEHPNLEALAEQGVPIYGINYKDEPSKAQAFLDGLGDPYVTVSADNSGRAAIEWGVYGVPETFVLAGDGTVILRFAGPVTQRALQAEILPALERASAQSAGSSQ